MLHDSTVAVVRTRTRAIPLPMINMRKSIHGFLFPYMVKGLRLAVLRAAGAPLIQSLFSYLSVITRAVIDQFRG